MCETCHENCLNCEDGIRDDVCTSCRDGMYLKDGKCVSSCDPKLAKNLAIRLADGTTEYEGRVEVSLVPLSKFEFFNLKHVPMFTS